LKTLITITACLCGLVLIGGATFIGIMYADHVLQQARAKQVPHLTVTGQYPTVVITNKQIELSGVTE